MPGFWRRASAYGAVKIRKLLRPRWGEAEYVEYFGRGPVSREGSDFRLISYDRDGSPDIEAYRQVQTAVNKAKLSTTFASEANILALCEHIGKARAILCHGTRNGAEQRYFSKAFSGARVLGTEISDTACQFGDTIRWDFHEVKPEWLGAWDVVYSNSWDHAYDPGKMLKAWISCLAPGGALVLEHSKSHEPDGCCAADPFGATVAGLLRIVAEAGKGYVCEPHILRNLPDRSQGRCFIIARVHRR